MTAAPSWHAWCFWLAAALLYFIPGWQLSFDFILGSKDAVFYTIVLNLYGQALADGEIYPRWFAAANGGQGSPVMAFYSPLSYLITNALFFWVPDDPVAHKRFLLGFIAAQIAAGYTAYLWLRPRFGAKSAILAGVLFIAVPYKLMYLWMQHNLAQFWALAWLPLWMLAAEHIVQKRRVGIAFYGICFALVAYTHLLTIIAFAAIPALYVLVLSKDKIAKRIAGLAVAHLIGLALCAVYLLPMAFNLQFVWTNGFTDGYYQVFNHLRSYSTYFCLYYLIIAALVAGLFSRLPALQKTEDKKRLWFFITITAIWWLMTTPVSYFVWKWVTPLQYLQFPVARLHVGLLIPFLWVALYGVELWKKSNGLPRWAHAVYSPPVALLSMIACGVFMYYMSILQYHCYPSRVYTGSSLAEVHRLNAVPPIEYITIWKSPELLTASLLDGSENDPMTSVLTGVAEANAGQTANRAIELHAKVHSEEATIGLRHWYFPGWEATDGNGNRALMEVNEKNGNMQITLPHGEHTLRVSLPWLLGEKAGMAVTLLTLFALLVYILTYRRLERRRTV